MAKWNSVHRRSNEVVSPSVLCPRTWLELSRDGENHGSAIPKEYGKMCAASQESSPALVSIYRLSHFYLREDFNIVWYWSAYRINYRIN